MQFLEWIIKISGVIAAIIAIWRVVVFFVHLSDDIKKTKEYVFANIESVEGIKEIKEHTFENYLSCLRLTIMSDTMPMGERIIAGDKYIKAGGNGEVKKFIENELHTKDTLSEWEANNGKA